MKDSAAITAKLVPMMETLPQVEAIKFGNTSGRSYLLTRHENTWMTRTTSPDRPGEIRWQEWVNGQPREL
ncbi:hypothetical protein HRM2_37880 [Desulforapulum autotrophicum HRM2]|uniref:Uncharacterized protein n=1 Tax=Desulforapulum autotrophicum (strain ATCC 43914 / DSM 3382 / VKM B-1955 / HRM2) TaxID=177437 RepID=C0QAR3_DESAH|nr:hypothetical protein [Desulforapulum autotrophicum]ACN16846.1 hypothetical protein HRM2_37880 [Desulforapulum autotrophicum HRM2]